MNFFEELKRRNVYKIATAYIVVAWIALQVGSLIFQNFGAPDWVLKTFTAIVLLGFPIACLLAWAFELTPEGIKKTAEAKDGGAGKLAAVYLVIFALLITGSGYGLMQIFNEESSTQISQSTSDGTTSIAVLPFVNMSSDPEQEYFSDGISEEILNVLAKNKGLRVAARTSSFSFKGRNQDIREIGNLLEVNQVLEGSIRKSGNRVRITAQLIKVDDGFHMWSETYDRELTDIFEMQDEITASIYSALKLHLLNEGDGPESILATDERAYEHYLLANELIRERDSDDLKAALFELDEALKIDPDYYPAHISTILGYTLLANTPVTYGLMTADDVREKVKPHLEAVERLAPNDAKYLAVKGFYEFITNAGNDQALSSLNAAVKLNPNLSEAYTWRSIIRGRMGDNQGALEDDEKAYALNPMFPLAGINLAGVYTRVGRLEDAERVINRLLKTPEAETYGYFGFMQTLLILAKNEGNIPGLIKGLQDKLEETGESFPFGLGLANAYRNIGLNAHAEHFFPGIKARIFWIKGNLEDALNIADELVEQSGDNEELLTTQAALSATLGYREKAKIIADRVYNIEGQDICREVLAYTYHLLGEEDKVQNIIPYCLQTIERDLFIRPYSYFDLEGHALTHLLNKDEASALKTLNNVYDMGGNFNLTPTHPLTVLFGDNPDFLAIKAKMDARAEELQLIIRDMEQRGELTNPFIS